VRGSEGSPIPNQQPRGGGEIGVWERMKIQKCSESNRGILCGKGTSKTRNGTPLKGGERFSESIIGF